MLLCDICGLITMCVGHLCDHQMGPHLKSDAGFVPVFVFASCNEAKSCLVLPWQRELLSVIERFEEHRTILLGQEIEQVLTDHKNPVHKHFNTEHVMCW